MKHRLFVGLALVALLALAACGGDSGSDVPSATLRVHAGSVEVSIDDATFSAGTDGQVLTEGATVRTGADGRAAIEYFDGSVTRLDHGTTFKIVTLQILDNDARSKVIEGEQTSGNTYNRVTELTDAASRFDIETPTATASVQGTVYAVLLNADGSTTIAVIEGSVDAGDVPVPAGFMVTVDEDGNVSDPIPIPDDLIDDEWIVYNCELDEGPDCPDVGSGSTTTTTVPPATTTTVPDTTTTTVPPTTTTTVAPPPPPPPTTTTTTPVPPTTTTTTVPPTTTTTVAPPPATTATTTTVPPDSTPPVVGIELYSEVEIDSLPYCWSEIFYGYLVDESGNVVDIDGPVTFEDVGGDGGSALSIGAGQEVNAVDGYFELVIYGVDNGNLPSDVSLQVTSGDVTSNIIEFVVVDDDELCDYYQGSAEEFVLALPGSNRPGIDPLAAFATVLLALLGVAAVDARRSMGRIA